MELVEWTNLNARPMCASMRAGCATEDPIAETEPTKPSAISVDLTMNSRVITVSVLTSGSNAIKCLIARMDPMSHPSNAWKKRALPDILNVIMENVSPITECATLTLTARIKQTNSAAILWSDATSINSSAVMELVSLERTDVMGSMIAKLAQMNVTVLRLILDFVTRFVSNCMSTIPRCDAKVVIDAKVNLSFQVVHVPQNPYPEPAPAPIRNNVPCDFQCWDGRCMPWAARCDGRKDCNMNEDEMQCQNGNGCNGDSNCPGSNGGYSGHNQGQCGRGQHRCDNGVCLSQDKVCNYVYDCCLQSGDPNCRDWSDENNCQ